MVVLRKGKEIKNNFALTKDLLQYFSLDPYKFVMQMKTPYYASFNYILSLSTEGCYIFIMKFFNMITPQLNSAFKLLTIVDKCLNECFTSEVKDSLKAPDMMITYRNSSLWDE